MAMFDLEREVARWSEDVHAGRCGGGGDGAELTDHLHCEIERGRSLGLSDEQAFAAAVARVGAARELAAEHAKNRTLLQTACAATRAERGVGGGGARKLLTAHAILWAALMIASSLVLASMQLSSEAAAAGATTWFLVGVLMPCCWMVSEQILRRALRRPASGG
jgi:hypothetical protein